MRFFTPEDLIVYYYGESAIAKSNAITAAIQQHWPTREKYSVIQKAASQLDKAMLAPRQSSVDCILQYAISEKDHTSC